MKNHIKYILFIILFLGIWHNALELKAQTIKIAAFNIHSLIYNNKELISFEKTIFDEIKSIEGYEAIGNTEFKEYLSSEEMDYLKKCKDDKCFANVGLTLDADQALWGIIDQSGDQVKIDIYLLDVKNAKRIKQTTYKLVVKSQNISKALRASIQDLLIVSPIDRKGSFELKGVPFGTEVFINNEKAGKMPMDKFVGTAIGVNKLSLKKEGYIEKNIDIIILSKETTLVKTSMQKIKSKKTSWWLWSAVGAVVTGSAIATAVVLTSDDTEKTTDRSISISVSGP